jgi:hypothetical protein
MNREARNNMHRIMSLVQKTSAVYDNYYLKLLNR